MIYDGTYHFDDGVFKYIDDVWTKIAEGTGPKVVIPESWLVAYIEVPEPKRSAFFDILEGLSA